MTELCRESRELQTICRVARDDAERPWRYARQLRRRRRGRDGWQMTVVDLCRSNHRPRVHVADDAEHDRVLDELLRNRGRLRPVALVIAIDDFDRALLSLRASVDVVERELDSTA